MSSTFSWNRFSGVLNKMPKSAARSGSAAALFAVLAGGWIGALSTDAYALDLDWSGQFRSEANFLLGYGLGSSADATEVNGGYTIPGGGKKDAVFESVFLKLRPKVIVNDNIAIKSELWAGDPVYGFFGSAVPGTIDRRQYYSNQSGGGQFSAQRYYAEFLSDIGTVVIGRAPLHWGLGMIWNASPDNLWDRYPTTGDTIRLVSKLGAFTFIPSIVRYSTDNSISSGRGLDEYSIAFRYENPEEDFEAGVNLIRRLGSSIQGAGGYLSPMTDSTGGVNTTTWDLYGRKRFGKLSVGLEVPIQNGTVDNVTASAVAAAVEADWRATDSLEFNLRGGYAPGQPSSTSDPSTYNAFYFHPDYRLGLILFNYQLANISGPSTQNDPSTAASSLKSPYDSPIVNAKYLTVGSKVSLEKWDLRGKLIFALADQVAKSGKKFLNTWERRMVDNAAGIDQGGYLGTELDFGVSFKWDDSFSFHADGGWLIPGEFYAFSNDAGVTNPTQSMFAASFKVGVNF